MQSSRFLKYFIALSVLSSLHALAGPLALDLKPGTWYKMRLEVVGDKARTTVDGITLEGHHPDLRVEKSKIGLNPGLAGGSIRNFKAWKVKAGS